MKKYLSVLIALMTCAFASAQDTIMFRNGRVEAVKVMEVGLGKVKYKKISNPDGPLFLLDEAEVESIKFQNGDVEAFDTVQEEIPAPVQRRHVMVKAGPVFVERVRPVNTNAASNENYNTSVFVSRSTNLTKYPLRYRKESPSAIAFDTEFVSEQEAYEMLGNEYNVFRENVHCYRTGRAMWAAGIGLLAVSGPIAIGAAANDSYAARHVALAALCSGSALFSVGMVRFVTGKRAFKNVLMNYNFEYNTRRQNVSELKFGLTGNGVGVNLTF